MKPSVYLPITMCVHNRGCTWDYTWCWGIAWTDGWHGCLSLEWFLIQHRWLPTLALPPQHHLRDYPYLPAIPAKPTNPDDPLSWMWWDITSNDFVLLSGNITTGLGLLSQPVFNHFKVMWNDMQERFDITKQLATTPEQQWLQSTGPCIMSLNDLITYQQHYTRFNILLQLSNAISLNYMAFSTI